MVSSSGRQGIYDPESWGWLRDGELKKETEGLIMAAQTQSLRTNTIKTNIDKTQEDPKCTICKQKEETVSHIVSECPKLAQREYKRRHDCVAKAFHWDLCRLYDIDCGNKWYEHQPEEVLETSDVKILWDFNIQTDNEIQARRPDIVVVNKKDRKCYIIDVAVPGDVRIAEKETEKIEKYDELKREVERLWKVRAKVIPIVLGALGAVTRSLSNYIKEIGVKTQIKLMQKICTFRNCQSVETSS